MDLSTYNIPAEKKVNLILANFANQYIKPKLLTSHPITSGNENKFDKHTPYPERDNLQLYTGKPVIETLTLETDAYEVSYFNEKNKTYDMAKIEGAKIVLDTVLLDVSMAKNIIRTAIDGLNGTVKEFVSDGDYNVTIRGAIVNGSLASGKGGTNFPFEDFKKLIAIHKAPISVKATSYFLSLFSIHNLVITDVSYSQKEGYTNTQLFELTCISDMAVDIIKINS